jgi:hypothetical protein
MNLSPEAFEQVLAELADRADQHQVPDRVPAVRGRARRASRRRAGAVATALAVVIVIAFGVTGSGRLPFLRGHGPGPAHKPAPAKPYLSVQLIRDEGAEAGLTLRRSGGRMVVIKVTVHGLVPQASGYQPGADATENLSELVLTADGGNRTVTMRPTQQGFHCDAGAPLVRIDTSFPVKLEYDPGVATPMLGSHEVAFTAGACIPVGLILQKLTVVVK